MPRKPTFSQMPGQGRPRLPGRTELTQAFDNTPSSGKVPLRTVTPVVVVTSHPSPTPAPEDIPPAEVGALGLVELSDPPTHGISIALTPNARVVQPFGASGTDHAAGLVPDPGTTAGTAKFLREDATWDIPSGGGGGGGSGTNDFYVLTKPVNSAFSWVNQGSASVTVTSLGFVALQQPSNGAADSLAMRVKAYPAPPCTTIIGFNFACLTRQYPGFGLVLRENGSGKLLVWGVAANGSMMPFCYTANSATSFNTSIRAFDYNFGPALQPLWLRIKDDGTTQTFAFSSDGETWIDYTTHPSTAWITANQIGFYVNNYGGTTDIAMTVMSFVSDADTPFDPTTLAGYGTLHLHGSTATTATGTTGDAIISLPDAGAGAHDFTGTSTYQAAGAGIPPMVVFDGSTASMSPTAGGRICPLTDFTLYFVIETEAGNSGRFFGLEDASSGTNGMALYNANQEGYLILRNAGSTGDINFSTTPSYGTRNVYAIRCNSAGATKCFLNGISVGSNSFTGFSDASVTMHIGSSGAGYANNWLGKFGRLDIFSAVHSNSDVAAMTNYCKSEWNIP